MSAVKYLGTASTLHLCNAAMQPVLKNIKHNRVVIGPTRQRDRPGTTALLCYPCSVEGSGQKGQTVEFGTCVVLGKDYLLCYV